jgi:hypothetical protein
MFPCVVLILGVGVYIVKAQVLTGCLTGCQYEFCDPGNTSFCIKCCCGLRVGGACCPTTCTPPLTCAQLYSDGCSYEGGVIVDGAGYTWDCAICGSETVCDYQ